MKILVTGGAGFIGSHLVRHLLSAGHERVVVVDALTYAGSLDNIADCLRDPRCVFVHESVTNRTAIAALLAENGIDAVLHLAAETHVDRSIALAAPFFETNVMGTLAVVEAIHTASTSIRLVHVSTDEVYGALKPTQAPFREDHILNPTSPYAASKAAADHLVMSFVRTHGLDAIITRCCNNYGPNQHSEKFIPLMIQQACARQNLPVYGDGLQVREWIHVADHCRALMAVLRSGTSGEVYNIGSEHEEHNVDVVRRIVQLTGADESQITHVQDRPAHDRRYAINSEKLRSTFNWHPTIPFSQGLEETVLWYAGRAVPSSETGSAS